MQQFLVDTNLLVAAIKNPGKKAGALDLLLELISNEEIHIVGNDLLLMEFDKYSEKFKSKTTSHLIKKFKDKIVVVDVGENCIKECGKYFQKNNIVDLIHAATCLQENLILITNDKHFDKIMKNKIIQVWSISLAIQNLL